MCVSQNPLELNYCEPYATIATFVSALCHHQTWFQLNTKAEQTQKKNLITRVAIIVVNGLASVELLWNKTFQSVITVVVKTLKLKEHFRSKSFSLVNVMRTITDKASRQPCQLFFSRTSWLLFFNMGLSSPLKTTQPNRYSFSFSKFANFSLIIICLVMIIVISQIKERSWRESWVSQYHAEKKISFLDPGETSISYGLSTSREPIEYIKILVYFDRICFIYQLDARTSTRN